MSLSWFVIERTGYKKEGKMLLNFQPNLARVQEQKPIQIHGNLIMDQRRQKQLNSCWCDLWRKSFEFFSKQNWVYYIVKLGDSRSVGRVRFVFSIGLSRGWELARYSHHKSDRLSHFSSDKRNDIEESWVIPGLQSKSQNWKF